MANRTAPYNDAMQLGQGFNSFTQEILAEDAVFIERLHTDTPSASHLFDARWQNAQIDGNTSVSEASGFTSATPTSTQWNRMQADSGGPADDAGPQPVTARDRKAPIRTFTSRFVDSLSEVIAEMKISSAVPILNASQQGSDLGLPFDVRPFLEADLNYYLGVKEGFIEGGQLSAIVSAQVPNKKKRAEVMASLDAVLSFRQGKFRPIAGAVESAIRTLTEHSKITVTLYKPGGRSIVLDDDQPTALHSLRNAAAKFPELAADQPERIYAILTRFDSLSSFHSQGATQSPVCVRYDHCALYANMLLDAFVEYKNIDRQLSAHIAAVKAGSMRFEPAASGGKPRFANSWTGTTRAKRECMRQMIKILKEVEEVKKNPEIATVEEREEPFEDPLIFGEYIPRVEPVPDLDLDEEEQEAYGPLCSDVRGELLPAEKAKVEKLRAENPGLGKQTRMDVPRGAEGTGKVFCSLDYLKPDWVLAEVSVNVWRGVVCTLSLRYTNGLVTTFGKIDPRGRLIRLRLKIEANEKIVGCSVETGQSDSIDANRVRITALRLSTNRGSTLVGQSSDWKEPIQQSSTRDGAAFERLQMVHFDPILEGGYLHGFWGQTSPDGGLNLGFTRIAPIWSNVEHRISGSIEALDGVEEYLDREVIPSGVWNTYKVHDCHSLMPRTPSIIQYENPFPDRQMPLILAGFRKMDTWHGANMRFSASIDFVTNKEFSIGVDQWSNSLFYG
ncbi:hypothetical protein DIS24_g12593 [Lasiodiplodia hormozganensis]|uniref:H-type lectin domain-containing protein n=1 Tax=Lasiodiplodia hormozganensis TaxID=869390 RepID=A0AA39TUV8_9PEZI|nr:hypothetical protein DIS24_g12593 [Lasiodiplodia hormozganensis]